MKLTQPRAFVCRFGGGSRHDCGRIQQWRRRNIGEGIRYYTNGDPVGSRGLLQRYRLLVHHIEPGSVLYHPPPQLASLVALMRGRLSIGVKGQHGLRAHLECCGTERDDINIGLLLHFDNRGLAPVRVSARERRGANLVRIAIRPVPSFALLHFISRARGAGLMSRHFSATAGGCIATKFVNKLP